jgi:transposase
MDLFFAFLGKKNAKNIRLAVMDMWKAFRNSTHCHAPQAAILFDKFHVVRHLSDALDVVRRSEYKRVTGDDRGFIKGQRYVLLSRSENLTDYGRANLERLLHANARLNIAYLLREQFEQLWDYADAADMRAFFSTHGAASCADKTSALMKSSPPWSINIGTASPPTASRPTKSRLASSKASITKSASSNAAPMACATRNTSNSKSSPQACPRCKIPQKSPTKKREEPDQ